ncbi:hypothetical protein P831_04286 [Klebsiella aerogenes UCI 28]|nr:hypothetical protein P848_02541 [Klebsiella aerogenes UCI 45]EUL75710.1 hypothetical protein P831_04286 [Klebsiella aerogenes UCI 28]EUL83246.1 hypothetical protein P830_02261 [Klebsiella aerogenes UCI 27]
MSRHFVIGSLAAVAGDISAVSLFCIDSRSAVRFSKQLGKHSSGLGFCRACCGNCGNAAGFTSCELAAKFGELLLQAVASTLSSISIGLYFCQFFICSFLLLVCGLLAALFFGPFCNLSMKNCCRI